MLGGFNHFPTHLNSWTSITVESSHTKHAIFSWLYPHLMILTHPVVGAVSRRYLWSPLMSSARPSSSWCPANPPCASSNRPHPKHRNCRRRPKGPTRSAGRLDIFEYLTLFHHEVFGGWLIWIYSHLQNQKHGTNSHKQNRFSTELSPSLASQKLTGQTVTGLNLLPGQLFSLFRFGASRRIFLHRCCMKLAYGCGKSTST